MSVDYRIGDVRDRLTEIPDGSVDLITCSPPFLALRSYLPADHDAKHAEIGSEATPSEFLSTLLALTGEWRRVLTPHGSIAIELGDSYSGASRLSAVRAHRDRRRARRAPAAGEHEVGEALARGKGEGSDTRNPDSDRFRGLAVNVLGAKSGNGWPLPKSLVGIPTLYAWSLAYGRNLLDPSHTLAPWRVRNVIVWARPNPAVGALGDKFRPATSYITVACVSDKRWFDLDAVRDKSKPTNPQQRAGAKQIADISRNTNTQGTGDNPAGAPPLDAWYDDPTDADDGDLTWKLSTEGSSLAHYAMWPSTLAARLVDSMCPREVCTVCGEARRRMVGKASYERTDSLGWSDCGHDSYRPGLVLDPFAGTGTTLAVADILGRDAIGIDLDPRNADLYPRRYDEVRRKLNPSAPRLSEGQLDIFGEVAS